jgi:hypothetical protein
MPERVKNRFPLAFQLLHRRCIHDFDVRPTTGEPCQEMSEARGKKEENSLSQFRPLFMKR